MLKRCFIIVSIILYSSIFLNANVIDSIKYKNALQQYNSNNYLKSYELFEKLFWDNLQNADVNFYLASSAYYIQKYDEALSAYERIVIQYPKDQDIWFEIAKTYYMQKNYLKSKEILSTIKPKLSTKELLSDVKKYKQLLADKLEKSIFRANIIVGLGKNSNVNNKNLNEVSKTFHQELLVAKHRYNINNNYSIKNNLILLNKKITSHESINMLAFKPSLEKSYSNYIVDYAFLYEKIKIGGNNYLNTYSIIPKIIYQYANDLKINTIFKFTKNSYTDENKDSKIYGIKFIFNKINSNKASYNSSVYYNKSTNIKGDYFRREYTNYGIDLAYTYVYNKNIILIPSVNYEKINYKDDNPTYSKEQKDTKLKLSISSIYLINKSLFVQAYINNTKLSSTIAEEEYTTTIIGININKSF